MPCRDSEPPNKICAPAGIYIHIPFCLKKCPYCNFYSTTDLSLKEKFINALFREIDSHYNGFSLPIDTIYFGGGTPSLLSPEEIFLNTQKDFLNISRSNKTSRSLWKSIRAQPGLKIFMDISLPESTGSISVFSHFRTKYLGFLGRIHSARDACMALISARNAGFSNIGIDLIYGLSDQNLKDWENDLQKALSFHPEHLSCYMLSYERKTPFYKARKNGHILPPDENLSGNLFFFYMGIFIFARLYSL
jgi:oxygen-independent coproporphyrinogen III oxidase